LVEEIAAERPETTMTPRERYAEYQRAFATGPEDHSIEDAREYAYERCREEMDAELDYVAPPTICPSCRNAIAEGERTRPGRRSQNVHDNPTCWETHADWDCAPVQKALAGVGIPPGHHLTGRSRYPAISPPFDYALPLAATPSNRVETRVWALFDAARASAKAKDDADRDRHATSATIERLRAAQRDAPGLWMERPMTLPPRMVLVLAELAEAIDATFTDRDDIRASEWPTGRDLTYWADLVVRLYSRRRRDTDLPLGFVPVAMLVQARRKSTADPAGASRA